VTVDPFERLRQPIEPVVPDPRFTTFLRARLVDALAVPTATVKFPERTAMTTTTASPTTPLSEPRPAPSAIVPYVCVTPAVDAIAWYTAVFGAVEEVRYTGDDGRIGHAELRIRGALLTLADEYPEEGHLSAHSLGGSPVLLQLTVDDVDAVHILALEHGADVSAAPADQPYGNRMTSFVDPFGLRWLVQTVIAVPTTAEIQAAVEGYTITEGGADAS